MRKKPISLQAVFVDGERDRQPQHGVRVITALGPRVEGALLDLRSARDLGAENAPLLSVAEDTHAQASLHSGGTESRDMCHGREPCDRTWQASERGQHATRVYTAELAAAKRPLNWLAQKRQLAAWSGWQSSPNARGVTPSA
jgi:hypothetical protein